jgi:alanine dehydrogenase
MVRVLSDEDVAAVLELEALLPVVEDAFLAMGRGDVESPERPHFPVGVEPGGDRDAAAGTALLMGASIHGADYYATKVAGVHEANPEQGLETVNAVLTLCEAGTGLPAAVMAGNRVTNARTGCIGGLAVRELAAAPVTLGVLGAGAQARWQTRAIAAATEIDHVRVYSPSESKAACANDLAAEPGVSVSPVASARAAVEGADVVVTATTATNPVFPGEALDPGTLVVGVGAYSAETRELDATTIERAARVFADVPAEVAEIGDLAGTGLDAEDLVPFSAVLAGEAGRHDPAEVLVVESVGTAVLDAATGEYVLDAAAAAGVGSEVPL